MPSFINAKTVTQRIILNCFRSHCQYGTNWYMSPDLAENIPIQRKTQLFCRTGGKTVFVFVFSDYKDWQQYLLWAAGSNKEQK